jgi:hypothetical protein
MSDDGEKQSPARAYKRRTKWVKPELQLKIVLMTLSVATIVLVINFQLNLLGLSRIHGYPASTIDGTLDLIRSSLLKQFLIACCLVVPLSIWVGAVYAFKFCGPIYRFRLFFRELAQGRWDPPCRLRKGDDLQDVKDSINACLDLMKERLKRQHELLGKAREALASPSTEVGEGHDVQVLLSKMDQEAAEFEKRFGGGSVISTPNAAEPVACETL